MKYKGLIVLFLMLPLVVGSVPIGLAAPGTQGEVSSDIIFSSSERDSIKSPMLEYPEAPFMDVTVQGTGWRSQNRDKFSMFKIKAWGTKTQLKVPGDTWVHIPITHLPNFGTIPNKISQVNFCAASSNWGNTKPIKIELWFERIRIYNESIIWVPDPATDPLRCHTVSLSPKITPFWLGISVKLHFHNASDVIKLYGAWTRLVQ